MTVLEGSGSKRGARGGGGIENGMEASSEALGGSVPADAFRSGDAGRIVSGAAGRIVSGSASSGSSFAGAARSSSRTSASSSRRGAVPPRERPTYTSSGMR
jgi:hypothetical protein